MHICLEDKYLVGELLGPRIHAFKILVAVAKLTFLEVRVKARVE